MIACAAASRPDRRIVDVHAHAVLPAVDALGDCHPQFAAHRQPECLVISSHAPLGDGGTVGLSDPALGELWSRAVELDATIFVHPFGCTLDARLDRNDLSNIVDQPGRGRRGRIPSDLQRRSGSASRPADARCARRRVPAHVSGSLRPRVGGPSGRPDLPAEAVHLRRLHFDSLVHTPDALHRLVGVVGDEQVLSRSDYPFDMGVDDPLERVRAAGLSDSDMHHIATANAQALGLVPAPTNSSAQGVL